MTCLLLYLNLLYIYILNQSIPHATVMDEHKAELGKHAAFAAETSKAGKSRFSAASPLPPHPEIERERVRVGR